MGLLPFRCARWVSLWIPLFFPGRKISKGASVGRDPFYRVGTLTGARDFSVSPHLVFSFGKKIFSAPVCNILGVLDKPLFWGNTLSLLVRGGHIGGSPQRGELFAPTLFLGEKPARTFLLSCTARCCYWGTNISWGAQIYHRPAAQHNLFWHTNTESRDFFLNTGRIV